MFAGLWVYLVCVVVYACSLRSPGNMAWKFVIYFNMAHVHISEPNPVGN